MLFFFTASGGSGAKNRCGILPSVPCKKCFDACQRLSFAGAVWPGISLAQSERLSVLSLSLFPPLISDGTSWRHLPHYGFRRHREGTGKGFGARGFRLTRLTSTARHRDNAPRRAPRGREPLYAGEMVLNRTREQSNAVTSARCSLLQDYRAEIFPRSAGLWGLAVPYCFRAV